tara:strand:+ start:530 stop:736 length:207 start_codon:yes stop_codon:yes gene_type:complete
MKLETNTIVRLELDSDEARALMHILNGFRALELNNKLEFEEYSLGNKEEAKIDVLSTKLNSISETLNN